MRHTFQSEEGSVLLEFALFISFSVLLFMGIVDYALYISADMQLQEAASAAAAYAATPGAYPGANPDSSVVQFVAAQSAGISNMSVNVAKVYSCTPGGGLVLSSAFCGTYGNPLEFVQVTTTATVVSALHFPGIPNSLLMTGFASYEVPWGS